MDAITADTSAKSPPAMSQEFASVDMDSQAADGSVNNFSAASSALMSAELPARCSDGVDPPAPTDFQQAVGVQAEADEVKSLQAATLLESNHSLCLLPWPQGCRLPEAPVLSTSCRS